MWSLPAADEPVPEQLIAGAPDVLVNHMLDAWSDDGDVFPPEVRAEYVAQFRDPDTVHAICEGYRAAWYDPLEIWKTWADDLDGGPISAGHFIPEEAPDETTRRLVDFLG